MFKPALLLLSPLFRRWLSSRLYKRPEVSWRPRARGFCALLRVGEPAEPGAEIHLHVLGIVCRRDHAGDRRLGKYIFEEQLCPARAIEFARPVGQGLPANPAEQIALLKGLVDDNRDTVRSSGR